MTKYREILRLKGLRFSERNIALSVLCSRNTVSKVLKCAEERGISWPLSDSTTDGDLEKLLSPSAPAVTSKRMPDFAYIRKELLKNGVSKKLLWTETKGIILHSDLGSQYTSQSFEKFLNSRECSGQAFEVL